MHVPYIMILSESSLTLSEGEIIDSNLFVLLSTNIE